jgi:hypothetical protein
MRTTSIEALVLLLPVSAQKASESISTYNHSIVTVRIHCHRSEHTVTQQHDFQVYMVKIIDNSQGVPRVGGVVFRAGGRCAVIYSAASTSCSLWCMEGAQHQLSKAPVLSAQHCCQRRYGAISTIRDEAALCKKARCRSVERMVLMGRQTAQHTVYHVRRTIPVPSEPLEHGIVTVNSL